MMALSKEDAKLAKLVLDAAYSAREEGNLEIALALAMAREAFMRTPSNSDRLASWTPEIRDYVLRHQRPN